jgi:hypothetical protein
MVAKIVHAAALPACRRERGSDRDTLHAGKRLAAIEISRIAAVPAAMMPQGIETGGTKPIQILDRPPPRG